MSVFDTEMFIAYVEKRENPWKSICKDNSDKYARSRAWDKIGSSILCLMNGTILMRTKKRLKVSLLNYFTLAINE